MERDGSPQQQSQEGVGALSRSSSNASQAMRRPSFNALQHSGSNNIARSSSQVVGATADDIEMQRLRTLVDLASANPQVHDPTLGGLLTEQGEDVRRKQVEEDAQTKRRIGTWRGMSLAPDASLQWDFAMETFDYKVQGMVLTNGLILYCFFIVAFCFFFLVPRDITDNYFFANILIDTLTGNDIAKLRVQRKFADITSSAQFIDYICDIILIQAIDYTYPTGGNYFLGALRLRTQRVRSDTCAVNSAVIPSTMPTIFQQCYGDLSDSTQDVGFEENDYNSVPLWAYQSCAEIGHGQAITGQVTTYDCGGYMFEMPWWRPMLAEDNSTLAPIYPFPNANYERVPLYTALYQYIYPRLVNSNPPFFDDLATRLVAAELFAFNPGLRSFIGIKLYAEVASGGFWYPMSQFRVFSVWTEDSVPQTVYDAFFYLFVFYYIYQFFADLLRYYRREHKILAYFFDLWIAVDLVNLTIFLIVGAYKIRYISLSRETNLQVDQLTFTQRYPVELDDILDAYMMQVYLNTVNTVLTFLKLLKYLRLNDRLNILTRTLAASQDSIIGVLIIFLLIVTAYAMTGYGLFGLGVWGFRSVDASFSTMLQLLTGHFDYQSIKQENRIEAGFFFWTYVILAWFCMLNFLIGVLMQAFAEVSKTRPLLPLETVLAKTWSDWRRILKPSTLWHACSQLIRGNTKEVLLQDAVEMLKMYRNVKYPPSCPTVLEDQVMTLEDYEYAIDEELAEKVGKAYMAYIWDDIVYEWDMSKEAEHAIKAHRDMAMTTKGVKSAIGKEMKLIESFSGRMTTLEKSLTELITLLEGRTAQK